MVTALMVFMKVIHLVFSVNAGCGGVDYGVYEGVALSVYSVDVGAEEGVFLFLLGE